MRFTKPTKVIGLDIGTHSIKTVLMTKPGGKLRIEEIGYAPLDKAQVTVDPVAASAEAMREALQRMPTGQSLVVASLAGQTVVIRYPRLRDVSLDEIGRAVEAEASQNIPYDLSEVLLDWSLLEEENNGDETLIKVLLVAAKHEVIDARVQLIQAAEVECSILSVDSLALADAAEGCDFLRVGESVALINIGASSVSIHFTKDGVSNFIRDISWGAKEMIQAIAKFKRCNYEEAERFLINIDDERDAEPERQVEDNSPLPDAPPELPSMNQASEPDALAPPSIDDPLASDLADPLAADPLAAETIGNASGSSLLDPLEDEIELLGATGPEASTESMASPGMTPDEDGLDEVLALPISRLVAEIRRSFDYYEHQLYERPVERVILSGGAAHLSLFRDALVEDLGIEDVEIADPGKGAIFINANGNEQFENHPAQFMVAVGLAARGSAEL